jgi:hypothetical protein
MTHLPPAASGSGQLDNRSRGSASVQRCPGSVFLRNQVAADSNITDSGDPIERSKRF